MISHIQYDISDILEEKIFDVNLIKRYILLIVPIETLLRRGEDFINHYAPLENIDKNIYNNLTNNIDI